MKKLTIVLILSTLMVTSCNDEKNTDPDPCPGGPDCNPVVSTDSLYLTSNYYSSILRQEIKYGEFQENTVEIFEPNENTSVYRPLILLSPGGGWLKFSRLDEMRSLCRNLATRGYVVGLVKYKIKPEGWSSVEEFMEMFLYGIYDQKAAIRYFRSNASDFGIDPEKIFLGGWSTGALLAISTVYWDEDDIADFELDQKAILEPLMESYGLEGSQHTGISSRVKGTLLLMPTAVEKSVFDANEPKMMMIQHEKSVYSDNRPRIGCVEMNFGDFSSDWCGADGINEEIQNLGLLDNYIRLSDLPANPPEHYANLVPMASEHFDDIARFFYNNLN